MSNRIKRGTEVQEVSRSDKRHSYRYADLMRPWGLIYKNLTPAQVTSRGILFLSGASSLPPSIQLSFQVPKFIGLTSSHSKSSVKIASVAPPLVKKPAFLPNGHLVLAPSYLQSVFRLTAWPFVCFYVLNVLPRPPRGTIGVYLFEREFLGTRKGAITCGAVILPVDWFRWISSLTMKNTEWGQNQDKVLHLVGIFKMKENFS